jgi:hypothetical protein
MPSITSMTSARRIGNQQRSLPKIVQHEGRKGHSEPCEPDRDPAEVPHIGVHGFSAGHCKKRGAEDSEADVKVLVDQKIERIERADCHEHTGRFDDAVDAEQGDQQKPRQHHRTEDVADETRALLLNCEQPNQDNDRERHYDWRQRRRVDLQALDSAENGDRRRNGPVAIEQCCANKTDN